MGKRKSPPPKQEAPPQKEQRAEVARARDDLAPGEWRWLDAADIEALNTTPERQSTPSA